MQRVCISTHLHTLYTNPAQPISKYRIASCARGVCVLFSTAQLAIFACICNEQQQLIYFSLIYQNHRRKCRILLFLFPFVLSVFAVSLVCQLLARKSIRQRFATNLRGQWNRKVSNRFCCQLPTPPPPPQTRSIMKINQKSNGRG